MDLDLAVLATSPDGPDITSIACARVPASDGSDRASSGQRLGSASPVASVQVIRAGIPAGPAQRSTFRG